VSNFETKKVGTAFFFLSVALAAPKKTVFLCTKTTNTIFERGEEVAPAQPSKEKMLFLC